eukprot:TRINITY_DN11996_c0_g1_i1.p1 TRINITY_DN11996_c0_g1~~TRINITY_DN11996_c0_g1_i1.p1  ORF type:complete len:100 (+),score=8.88 TRINITY_DN11996_c0_g1_i1:43-300(+)
MQSPRPLSPARRVGPPIPLEFQRCERWLDEIEVHPHPHDSGDLAPSSATHSTILLETSTNLDASWRSPSAVLDGVSSFRGWRGTG